MDDDPKRVTLYSLSTCPTCKRVAQFLDSMQVVYTRIEVDQLEGGEQWLASKEVERHNPSGTYPTLVVEEVIAGFDETRIRKALGLQ